MKIHIFQYESCPYCSQIRAYLDYFGISYQVTEVDAYDKTKSLDSFTKARMLPIVAVEDRVSRKRWNLVNATAILSALESLRNESLHINYEMVVEQFLPVLKTNSNNSLAKHPNKYLVLNNSELKYSNAVYQDFICISTKSVPNQARLNGANGSTTKPYPLSNSTRLPRSKILRKHSIFTRKKVLGGYDTTRPKYSTYTTRTCIKRIISGAS